MEKEELQQYRRERLEALSADFGGYAFLGRTLGYRDGAYISQMCKGKRNIKEDFVSTCEALPGYEGWFHNHENQRNRFTPELLMHLNKLPNEDIRRMENLLRSALSLKLLR